MDEDFGTPEASIKPMERDWEACMTFNDISWGYVDSEQAKPYSYNAQRILRMINTCARNNGNLLLNIGPTLDGSVPTEAIEPLTQVGNWLKENGEVVYGGTPKKLLHRLDGVTTSHQCGKTIYLLNWIWPKDGIMQLGGVLPKLKNARLVKDNSKIEFEQIGHRVYLKNLPSKSPDTVAGVAAIALEFDEEPKYERATYYPQLHGGEDLR